MYACRCKELRSENVYVSEALARAYKLHVRDVFSVGTYGGRTPPPNTQKLATYATGNDPKGAGHNCLHNK